MIENLVKGLILMFINKTSNEQKPKEKMKNRMLFINLLIQQIDSWTNTYPNLKCGKKFLERFIEASHFKNFCIETENNKANIAYFFFKKFYVNVVFDYLFENDYDEFLKFLSYIEEAESEKDNFDGKINVFPISLQQLIEIKIDTREKYFFKQFARLVFHKIFFEQMDFMENDARLKNVRFFDEDGKTNDYSSANVTKAFLMFCCDEYFGEQKMFINGNIDGIIEHFNKIEKLNNKLKNYDNLSNYTNSSIDKAFKTEQLWVLENFVNNGILSKKQIDEYTQNQFGYFKYVYNEIHQICVKRVEIHGNIVKNNIPYDVEFFGRMLFDCGDNKCFTQMYIDNAFMGDENFNQRVLDLLSSKKTLNVEKFQYFENIVKLMFPQHPYFKNFNNQNFSDEYFELRENFLKLFKRNDNAEQKKETKNKKTSKSKSKVKNRKPDILRLINPELKYLSNYVDDDFMDVFPERYIKQAVLFIKPFINERCPSLFTRNGNLKFSKNWINGCLNDYARNNKEVFDVLKHIVCFINLLRNLRIAYKNYEDKIKSAPSYFKNEDVGKIFKSLIDNTINWIYCENNRMFGFERNLFCKENVDFEKATKLIENKFPKWVEICEFYHPMKFKFDKSDDDENGYDERKGDFTRTQKFFNMYKIVFDCASICLKRMAFSLKQPNLKEVDWTLNNTKEKMRLFEQHEPLIVKILNYNMEIIERRIIEKNDFSEYNINMAILDMHMIIIPKTFDEFCKNCSISRPFYVKRFGELNPGTPSYRKKTLDEYWRLWCDVKNVGSASNVLHFIENFYIKNVDENGNVAYKRRFNIENTKDGIQFVDKETGKRFEFYKQMNFPTPDDIFYCANIVDAERRDNLFKELFCEKNGSLAINGSHHKLIGLMRIKGLVYAPKRGYSYYSLYLVEVSNDSKIKPIDWISKQISQNEFDKINKNEVFDVFKSFADDLPKDKAHAKLYDRMISNITNAFKHRSVIDRIKDVTKYVKIFIETIRSLINQKTIHKIVSVFNKMVGRFWSFGALSFSKFRLFYKNTT